MLGSRKKPERVQDLVKKPGRMHRIWRGLQNSANSCKPNHRSTDRPISENIVNILQQIGTKSQTRLLHEILRFHAFQLNLLTDSAMYS